MAENHQGNAGPSEPVVKSDALNVDAFAELLGQPAEQATGEETQAEEEQTPDDADADEAEEQEEGDSEDGDQIDFDKLTPEQILEAGKAGRSRLLKDLGRERAENRDLKKRLEALEQQQPKSDPLDEPKTVENKRIAAMSTLEELRAEKKNAVGVAKWAQGVLDEYGAAAADDVIHSEGEKEYTKRDLLKIRNSAQTIAENDVPARLEQIQQEEKRKEQEKQLEEYTAQTEAKAKELAPEAFDEKSPLSAIHKDLMTSPVMEQAIKAVPGFKGMATLLSALAAGKIEEIKKGTAGKPAATAKEGIPRAQAPAGSPNGGAPSSRPAGTKTKEQEAKRQQFSKSGSVDDYANLLASGL